MDGSFSRWEPCHIPVTTACGALRSVPPGLGRFLRVVSHIKYSYQSLVAARRNINSSFSTPGRRCMFGASCISCFVRPYPANSRVAWSFFFSTSSAGQADHYNVLIRGFGDARNLGAALSVFQTMREGVAVGGPGGGPRSRTLGWEVEEDMFAALVGACTRR